MSGKSVKELISNTESRMLNYKVKTSAFVIQYSILNLTQRRVPLQSPCDNGIGSNPLADAAFAAASLPACGPLTGIELCLCS